VVVGGIARLCRVQSDAEGNADDEAGFAAVVVVVVRVGWAEVLRAIRAGTTYVNIHTTVFPSGELRGQIDIDD